MDKRFWLTGFSFGLLLSVSACSEVENCERGERGCIGGPCIGNTCSFDLVCVNRVDSNAPICGREERVNTFDCDGISCVDKGGAGSTGGDGGTIMKVPCNCAGAGQLCVSGTPDQCVNYCEDPGFALSVGARRETQNLPCRMDINLNQVSFEAACKAAFRQFCMRAEAYCVGGAMPFKCEPGVLESADIQQFCQENFADVNEVSTYCESMRDGTCETFAECTDPLFPKSCTTPLVCNNTCPDRNDGACDDGDLGTAAYGVCDWGTDCGDCGPRTGTAPTLPVPIGGLCVSHVQCVGYSEDLRKNKSWCLGVGGTELDGNPSHRVFRCMSDCTLGDNCSDGYMCTALVDGNGEPLTQGDLQARVCDPQICI